MEQFTTLSELTARRNDQAARHNHVRWLCARATTISHTDAMARYQELQQFATKAMSPTAALDLTFVDPLVPPAPATAFGHGVSAASVLSRAGFQRVPFDIPVPQFDVSAISNTATLVSEGAAKPMIALATTHVMIPRDKIAAVVAVSREYVRSMPPGSETALDLALTSAIVLASDKAALDPGLGPDVAAGRRPSLTFGAAFTVTAPTPADASSALATLIAQYFAAVTPTRPVVVLGPAMVAWLASSGTHAQLSTNGGFVYGLPAVVSAAAGPHASIFDAQRTLYADDGASVDVGRHATIQMSDAPDTPPTAATPLVSMWQTNQIALRPERYCGWQASPSSTGVLTVTVAS